MPSVYFIYILNTLRKVLNFKFDKRYGFQWSAFILNGFDKTFQNETSYQICAFTFLIDRYWSTRTAYYSFVTNLPSTP